MKLRFVNTNDTDGNREVRKLNSKSINIFIYLHTYGNSLKISSQKTTLKYINRNSNTLIYTPRKRHVRTADVAEIMFAHFDWSIVSQNVAPRERKLILVYTKSQTADATENMKLYNVMLFRILPDYLVDK